MKVLICVEDRPKGEQLIDFYAKCLHREGDEAVVLNVTEKLREPVFVHRGGIGYDGHKAKADMISWKRAKAAFQLKYGVLCSEKNMKHNVVVVQQNDKGIADTILKVAKKYEVNLIVMGTRGLGVLGTIFLGSVDDEVKRHSTIPTLVCNNIKS